MFESKKTYINVKDIDMFEVAKHYFNVTRFPCRNFCSPLREDKHPSCDLFARGSVVYFKDFATGETFDIIILLQKMWQLPYKKTLEKIANDLLLNINEGNCNYGKRKYVSNNSVITSVKRNWEKRDEEYWNSYGVTLDELKKSNVYPISKIVIDNGKCVSKRKADDLAYTFVENKEGRHTEKIYQPLNKDGWKWRSGHDKSTLSLWTRLPSEGNSVIICSSLKDASCLRCNTGIPAIAVQGEGMDVSNTAMNVLKSRFKNVYLCFDSDERGLKNGKALSERLGIENIVLPHYDDAKDISDIYKKFGKEKIVELFKDYK